MKMRSPLIRHLEYQMEVKHMSNFLIETGKKGSGKSWLGLRFGELINGKDFDIHNVCFSSATLLDRLDKKEYSKGDVILLEELGVAANSRDAMTKANKNLSFIAQTIRPEAITIIANSITWGLIDVQVKNMADFRLKVMGYDVLTELTEFKFLTISPNDTGQEPFQEHLQFGGEKIVSWTLKRPSKELTDVYEPMRTAYLRQLYSGKGINENAEFGVQQTLAVPRETLEQLIEKGLMNKVDYMEEGKLSRPLIEIKMGISRQRAQTVARGIRLKWKELGGEAI